MYHLKTNKFEGMVELKEWEARGSLAMFYLKRIVTFKMVVLKTTPLAHSYYI